jgi:mannose-6-phosphate isomerase-like protein (cupin superfamily)
LQLGSRYRLHAVIRTIKSSATKTFQWSPKTEIAAIKLRRYDLPTTAATEGEMEIKTPSIIDLNAELAKLRMFRRTPQSTREETKGSIARLASYRDGLLLAIKASGKDHWERHLTGDELIHILDGSATLEIVCDDGPPKSFALRAGMVAVIPQGAWHRALSPEGKTEMTATPFPGDHIELDVDDPRTVEGTPASPMAARPSIIDLNAELSKLTMFRGRTPQSTMGDRKGSAARLVSYRDGALTATKFAGKGHWESHPAGDELIHVLDGTATLEIVCDDGPPKSFVLSAGTMAVNPQGAWHRFHSTQGVTLMTATPFSSEVIELNVDDPRTVQRKSDGHDRQTGSDLNRKEQN